MLENDAHMSGLVDRILVENMILLCSETVEFLYNEYTSRRSFYEKGTWPELEQCNDRVKQTGVMPVLRYRKKGWRKGIRMTRDKVIMKRCNKFTGKKIAYL